ncbi:hypothetical protein RB195_004965 [Necator americanus]|uniref:Uncharacterized protein n=1 Tax=Necator americanus TaxID=51031 RepID=A0ABR1BKJ6_NECAM
MSILRYLFPCCFRRQKREELLEKTTQIDEADIKTAEPDNVPPVPPEGRPSLASGESSNLPVSEEQIRRRKDSKPKRERRKIPSKPRRKSSEEIIKSNEQMKKESPEKKKKTKKKSAEKTHSRENTHKSSEDIRADEEAESDFIDYWLTLVEPKQCKVTQSSEKELVVDRTAEVVLSVIQPPPLDLTALPPQIQESIKIKHTTTKKPSRSKESPHSGEKSTPSPAQSGAKIIRSAETSKEPLKSKETLHSAEKNIPSPAESGRKNNRSSESPLPSREGMKTKKLKESCLVIDRKQSKIADQADVVSPASSAIKQQSTPVQKASKQNPQFVSILIFQYNKVQSTLNHETLNPSYARNYVNLLASIKSSLVKSRQRHLLEAAYQEIDDVRILVGQHGVRVIDDEYVWNDYANFLLFVLKNGVETVLNSYKSQKEARLEPFRTPEVVKNADWDARSNYAQQYMDSKETPYEVNYGRRNEDGLFSHSYKLYDKNYY